MPNIGFKSPQNSAQVTKTVDFRMNANNVMNTSASSGSIMNKFSPPSPILEVETQKSLPRPQKPKHSFPKIETGASKIFADSIDNLKMNFMDIRKTLYETNKKRKDYSSPNTTVKLISEDDYSELEYVDPRDDFGNVKTLEKWNIELRKTKGINILSL